MREWMRVFKAGLSIENPLTILMIGLCATLAVSSQVQGSLFMGVAVIFVLVMSNVLISAFRRFIPNEVRIPIFIVIIASFVTIVDLFLKAYFPAIYAILGIWIPLIVVNGIILGRAEAFASKNPVLDSAVDGLGMGAGFTLALTLIGSIRELVGNGSIFGISLLGASYQPMLLIILPAGGFLVFGSLLGIINAIGNKRKKGAKA